MRRAPPAATLLPVVALLSGIACAGADGRGAPAEAPAPAPDAPGERRQTRMRVVRNEKAIEAKAGDGIDLVVTRPVGIPQELRFAWPPAPSIEGEAVRFVRLRIEEPPPEDDGGVTTHHYELAAVRIGTARVTLTPRPASREAAQAPVVLDVTVRAAPTR